MTKPPHIDTAKALVANQNSPNCTVTSDCAGKAPEQDVEAARETTSNRAKHLNLYFIRHGETEWSLSGQYTGSPDSPLTARGEDAAREVWRRLRGNPSAYMLTSPQRKSQ